MITDDKNNINREKIDPMDFKIPDDSEMQHAWDNVDSYKDQFPKPNMDKMWKGTKQKLGWEVEPKVVPFRKKLLWYAAAVAIPLMIFSSIFYFSIEKISSNKGLISYKSPEGKRTMFNLPDGSTIWLQPNSEIKYPKEFDSKKREIYFNGQAYFDVKHDPICPFVINMETTTITVLGTQFYVKASQNENNIETGLISGKVKIAGSKFEKTLSPNDVVIISKELNSIVDYRKLSSNAYTWENSSMVFSNCSFGTIVKNISEWYGVKYYIDPKIDADKKITLTIRDESIEEIAEILKIVIPFEYKISDNRMVYTLGK
jgi:ferric-dicitrate binding protein FerR (iron transport regulator)